MKKLAAKIGISGGIPGGLGDLVGAVRTGGSVGPIINNRRRRSLDEVKHFFFSEIIYGYDYFEIFIQKKFSSFLLAEGQEYFCDFSR